MNINPRTRTPDPSSDAAPEPATEPAAAPAVDPTSTEAGILSERQDRLAAWFEQAGFHYERVPELCDLQTAFTLENAKVTVYLDLHVQALRLFVAPQLPIPPAQLARAAEFTLRLNRQLMGTGSFLLDYDDRAFFFVKLWLWPVEPPWEPEFGAFLQGTLQAIDATVSALNRVLHADVAPEQAVADLLQKMQMESDSDHLSA